MKKKNVSTPVAISITGRHAKVTPVMKEYAGKKISRLQKYFDKIMEARVIVSSEKLNQIVEVNISANGFALSSQSKTADIYSSIDMVVEKLERQIKKHREKQLERKRIASLHKIAEKEKRFPSKEKFEDILEENRIVRIERVSPKPMSPDEAAMQMDISDNSFLVFINSNSNEVNVIYRRTDGNYGLITRK